MRAPEKLPPLSVPAEGRLHLLPFLIPTTICDADNTTVVDAARSLVPAGISVREKAILIRAWIRENIKYTLDDKKAKASDTLAKREGDGDHEPLPAAPHVGASASAAASSASYFTSREASCE